MKNEIPEKEEILRVLSKELDFFLKDNSSPTMSGFWYYLAVMYMNAPVPDTEFWCPNPIALTHEETSSLIKTLWTK